MTAWRERFVDLAGVTAITIVVWLYAAGQTLQSRVIAFDILIESGDETRTLVAAPAVIHATVECSGSRQAVIRASDSLSGRTIRLRTGADGIPAQPGSHDVPLKDVLGSSPAVAPLGIDITTVNPAVVQLEIIPAG